MTGITDLLKTCRIEADNGRWLYWDGQQWVVRDQPYRARTSRVLSVNPDLLGALEALTKEDA